MKLYEFRGVVMHNDRVIDGNCIMHSRAVSPAKARSNMAWRYKKEIGLGGKVSLIGEIREVE